MKFRHSLLFIVFVFALLMIPARFAFAQTDQGAITGVVQDQTGAVIGGASVTLTSLDEGSVLKTKANGAGIYVFSPVKIGNYKVSVSAPGFENTTQTNLQLHIQQTLNIAIALKPGAATETITVTTEEPLMQTQESSVGQALDSKAIESIPVSGGNWMYVALLGAGTAPPEGSRGAGTGDFSANGQRPDQNNFILDGVDNNTNVVDFYNGASYVVRPPTDALSEMKVQTADYSAEFGHSAGAVVNATIKSGSNNFHGSLWESVRNTALDIHDWNAETLPVPAYHENLFGATVGGPIFKNKLFLFGDAQANRIRFSETTTETVPTLLERAGDFSEILNGNLTGNAPAQLYHQSATAAPVAITNNCLVTSTYCTASQGLGITLNQTAQTLLKDYPQPNANNGLLYNNYIEERPVVDDTFQWDLRADWNIGPKDTAYSRHSYWNEVGFRVPPLGNILDGGGFGDDGPQKNLGQSFMVSEAHVFTQTLTNEARFGFTYLHAGFTQIGSGNNNFAAANGFGGIPVGPENGGMPAVSVTGISSFGSPTWAPVSEHQNVYQIIDNVTKVAGNHTLKAGVSFESIRFSTLEPKQSRGSYNYTGEYTSNLNASNTGYGVADFLLDQQNSAGLSNEVITGDARWDNAAFFQDDWRVNQKLTLNLGVRWEHVQPYEEVGGHQASYSMTGPYSLNTTTGYASGKAQYLIPTKAQSYAAPIMTANGFTNVLAKDNISLIYDSDPHLAKSQHLNFGPRVGVSYSLDSRTVVRAGFGIFYGGLESIGYGPNLSENYPMQYVGNYPAPSCGTYNCPTDGLTMANGFTSIIANGFASDVENLGLNGEDPNVKTPYAENFNLTIEHGFGNDFAANVGYVGNLSRHMLGLVDPNSPIALQNPNINDQQVRPLPDFGGTSYVAFTGESAYDALQATLQKRMSHGYTVLATYTWSQNRSDAHSATGTNGSSGLRNFNLLPIETENDLTGEDVRQRFTFSALYQIPFGIGQKYFNTNRAADYLIGGWSVNAVWVAQTGNPFSIFPNGISSPQAVGTRANKIKDPYATGGTFQSPNPSLVAGTSCATSTKNHTHWFNPCSFANPWNANDRVNEPSHYIPTSANDPNTPAGDTTPAFVTSIPAVIGYAGGQNEQMAGPGYQRANVSIFKDFKTYEQQALTFRVDAFNLLNTPSYAMPSSTNINSQGGAITSPRSLQNDTPDSRFFQVALSYRF
jgi:hypothetical protein